ncbi:hypothetical protein ACFSKN_02535 [Mariniflexile gromovii]|uniref:Orn/DAP/Arg decarboxylase 2 N-terminal domain-containing protein n=1 Tax=Mariniflexile gromovii TaxID=362523 RepID=A0ABS4BPH4_9FLAO|nr:hypothetical protein [Mariniflexile gromovii]MBP0902481.1 hypothetical protein [Mariniflexile gromovii]
MKNIKDLKFAFNKYHDKIIIGYSYKTNYIPKLCSIAKNNGVFAEVVSEMELDLAIKLGYNFDKIIFNGPLKKENDLERTLLGNSIVNLDSYYEIKILEKLVYKYPDKTFKVGLRINMSLIDENGYSSIQDGLDVGRFGFDFSSKEFTKAIKLLNKLGVVINALHGHTSTSDRSLKNFNTIAKTLCNVRNEFNLNEIEYFNVGGGFFGPMPKNLLNISTPTFEEYAKTIVESFQDDEWFNKHSPYIILEPGVSVVSNALSFVAKVIDIKKIRGKKFLLIEGGIYNVKPTGHKLNLPYEIISKKENHPSSKLYDVVGSTCMEKDVVMNNITIKKVKRNDYILIDNVGAYTIVKTPNFINYIPAIISLDKNGKVSVERHRQKIDDLLINYEF